MDIYDIIKDLPIKTVVEAGGHLGEDTERLCLMFPDSDIHTCEPNPKLLDGLFRLQNFYPNLSVHGNALSDEDGLVDFYVDGADNETGGASSILPIHSFFKTYVPEERKIQVGSLKLSSFCSLFGISRISLLWLDIEMMEYRVLKASEEVLDITDHIYLEISYERFREGQWNEDDMNNLLARHGLTQQWIEPQGHPELKMWQANALYSRA